MSAFLGVIGLEGQPADRHQLEIIASRLKRIGPDRQAVAASGDAGFIHCRLNTTWESDLDEQPLVFGDRYTLVGDIRLDNRDGLAKALGLAGAGKLTDAELTRQAWLKWGDTLTTHLLGDFAFIIWDKRERVLFAARDAFGVCTLYHARHRGCLLISNCLNAMLAWPDLDRTLDPESMGEFLLFGQTLTPDATPYSHIRQLRPAHHALFRDRNTHHYRYWQLPVDPAPRCRNPDTVVEKFSGLLHDAVADRFRSPSGDILTSGGLDSSHIAVAAADHAAGNGLQLTLTTLLETENPGESEHRMVKTLADQLGVRARVATTCDGFIGDTGAFSGWPCADPAWLNLRFALGPTFEDMSTSSRIAMTGQGGDAIMHKSEVHFLRLARSLRLVKLVSDVRAFYRHHGRRPSLGIRPALRRKLVPDWYPGLPTWLNPDLLKHTGLRDKWARMIEDLQQPKLPEDGTRPEARKQLDSEFWPHVFRQHAPEATGVPMVFRHPYFDLRLVSELIAMDQPEWFFRKSLLRSSGQGRLPKRFTERPKHVWQPRQGKSAAYIRQARQLVSDASTSAPIREYVHIGQYDRILSRAESLTSHEATQLNTPLFLLQWMSQF